MKKRIKGYLYNRTYIMKIGGKKIKLRLKQSLTKETSIQQNNAKVILEKYRASSQYIERVKRYIHDYAKKVQHTMIKMGQLIYYYLMICVKKIVLSIHFLKQQMININEYISCFYCWIKSQLILCIKNIRKFMNEKHSIKNLFIHIYYSIVHINHIRLLKGALSCLLVFTMVISQMNLVNATNQVNVVNEEVKKVITGFKEVEKEKALFEKDVYKDSQDLELPKEIEVILSDETTETIEITWESEENALSTVGTHEYHLVLPDGYQLKDDTIQLPFININVIERPYITGFKDYDGKSVYQTINIVKGTLEKDIQLPKTITAIFNNNETKEIDITWKTEKYDLENPQEKYQYYLILPETYQVQENICLPWIEVNVIEDTPNVLSDDINTLTVVDGVATVNTADEFIAAVNNPNISTIVVGNEYNNNGITISNLSETLSVNRDLTIKSYNTQTQSIHLGYEINGPDFLTVTSGGHLTLEYIYFNSFPDELQDYNRNNWKMINIEAGAKVTTGKGFSFSHRANNNQETGIIDVHGELIMNGGINKINGDSVKQIGYNLKGFIYVYSDGKVTLNDGEFSIYGGEKDTVTRASMIYNLGNVTVNGGTFAGIHGIPVEGSWNSIYSVGVFYNAGTLTIHNGTFENNGLYADHPTGIKGGVAYNDTNGKLIVNNGIFRSNMGKEGGVFYNANEGILEINGGEYKNNKAINGSVVYCDKSSKTTISGGYFDDVNTATSGTFAYLSSKDIKNNTITVGSFVIKNKPMILGTISTIGFINGYKYEENQSYSAYATGVTIDNALAHAIVIEPRKIYGSPSTSYLPGLIDVTTDNIKYVNAGTSYQLRASDRQNVQFLPYADNQYAASLSGNSIMQAEPTYEQVLKDVIYVDPIHGINGNSGTDYEHGVKTLEAACQRVKSGGKIYVRSNGSGKWEYIVAEDEVLEPRGNVTIMACDSTGHEKTDMKIDLIVKKNVTLKMGNNLIIGDGKTTSYLNIKNNGTIIKDYVQYSRYENNYYTQQPTPSAVCFKPNEDRKVDITAKFRNGSMYWSYWDEELQIFSAYDVTGAYDTLTLYSGASMINNKIGDMYFAQKEYFLDENQNNLSSCARVSVRNSWNISNAGLKGTNETVKGVHDGKITASGTELELMEYKLSTDIEYQEVGFGERELSGLKPGTYDIRYAARTESEAHTQITIAEGTALDLDVQLTNSELKTSINSTYKDQISFGIKNNSNAPIRVLNVTMDSNKYFGWYSGERIQGADNVYYYNAPISAYLPLDIAAGGEKSSFGSEGDNTIRIKQIQNNFEKPGSYEFKIHLTIEVAGQVQQVEIPVTLTVSAYTLQIEKKSGVKDPVFTKMYDGTTAGSYDGHLKDYYQIKLNGMTASDNSEAYSKIKTTITYDNKNAGTKKAVTIKFTSWDPNYAIDSEYNTLTYNTGQITPKQLTASDLSVVKDRVVTKECDLSYEVILKSGVDFNFAYGRIIDGDDVSLQLKGWNYYTVNYNDQWMVSSGAGKKKVKHSSSISAILGGHDKNNYTIDTKTASDFDAFQYDGEITKKKVTFVLKEGKTFDKEYDGSYELKDIHLSDYFTVEGLPDMPAGKITIHYTNDEGAADGNAGEKKLTIGGTKFSNPSYQPESIKNYFEYNNSGNATYPNLSISLKDNTATISKKKLTITRSSKNEPFTKEYDGTNKAISENRDMKLRNYFKLSGYIGDEYPYAMCSGTYQSKDASDNNLITLKITGLEDKYAVNYSIDETTFEIPGKIEKKLVSIILNDNKMITKYYDGTTEVLDADKEGFVKLYGVVDGETLTPQINSIAYASPDVGSYVDVNYDITLLAGDNTNLNNYRYTGKYHTGKGEIIKPEFAIQLNESKTLEKVYDGTTECQFNPDDFEVTIANSDQTYKIQSATLVYDQSGVNASKVIMSDIVIEGADTELQTVPEKVELEGKITPKPITINQIALATVTKVYDGNTTATLKVEHYQLEGVVEKETISLSATASYNSKNVAEANTVTVKDIVLIGTTAKNYILKDKPDTLIYTGKITPRSIELFDQKTITKNYDRKTSVTIDASQYEVSGTLSGENITVSFDAAFEDASIGNDKKIHCSNIQLIAGDNTIATNYTADERTFTFTGNIKAKQLQLVNGDILFEKDYDGTTDVNGITKGNYKLNGLSDGDDVDITFDKAYFVSKNANTKAMSIHFDNLQLTGKDADMYTISTSSVNVTGKINKKELKIEAIENAVVTKEYDGKNDAWPKQGEHYRIKGLVGEEKIELTSSVCAGRYENMDASESVNVRFMWSDFDNYAKYHEGYTNYTLPNGNITLPGKITPTELKVELNEKYSREYDGTTNATIQSNDLKLKCSDGTVVNLNTTVISALFKDVEVGTNKNITLKLGDLTIPSGSSEKITNYTFNKTVVLKGDITAIPVTINQIQDALVVKDYDGTDTTNFDGTKFELTHILETDKGNISLSAKGIQYVTADAYDLVNLTLIEPSLEGDAAKHYVIKNPSEKFVGKINKKDVTVTSQNTTLIKTYDGTTAITVNNGTDYIVDGIIDTDKEKVQLDYSIVLKGKDVNTADQKAIMTINGLKLRSSNNDAENYNLKTSSLDFNAQITPRDIEFKTEKIITRDYMENNTTATITNDDYSLLNVVQGESLTLDLGTVTYDSPHAGSRIVTAQVKGLIAGSDTITSNYTYPTSVTFQGHINGIKVSVNPTKAMTKVYDGTNTATMTSENYTLTGGPADKTFTITADATYDTKDVTASKVIATNIQLVGEGSESYEVIGDVEFTGSIIPRDITVKPNDQAHFSKVYDGNKNISITTDAYTLESIIKNDDISATSEAYFVDENVGTDKEMTAILTLSGKDSQNYTLTHKTITLKGDITKLDVDATWEVENQYVYSGKDQSSSVKAYYTDVNGKKQYVIVQCQDEKDFINADEYTFEVINNLQNYNLVSHAKQVKILPASIKGLTMTGIDPKGYAHTGSPIEISTIGIDGLINTDFTVTYNNNKNLGKNAKVTLTGIGNYTGTLEGTFTIYASDYSGDVLPINGRNDNGYYKDDITVTIPGHTVGKDYNQTGENIVLDKDGYPAKEIIYIVNQETGQIYQKEVEYFLDKTAPIINGLDAEKVYYVETPFTVTDESDVIVTIDNTEVTDYIIHGDVDHKYSVIATDVAGNTASITVTTKSIDSLVDKTITKDNVKSSDEGKIQSQMDALNAIDQTYATDEQKAKIKELIQYCEDLLKDIEQLKKDLDSVKEMVNSFDKEIITADNYKDLADIRDNLQSMIDSNHYIESEKEELNKLLDKVNDMLSILDELEQQIKNIEDKVYVYTKDKVKETDIGQLDIYLKEIDKLINSPHISTNQKERLDELKDYINELKDIIKDLQEQLDKLDKIDDLTTDNVGGKDKDILDEAKDVIDKIETEYQDNLTDDQQKVVDDAKDKLDDLQKVLDDLENKVKELEEKVHAYTPENVKDTNRDVLNDLKDEIHNLLEDTRLTENQKERLNDLIEYIDQLLDILDQLNEKLDNLAPIKDLTVDTVGEKDQEVINQVKDVIQDILNNNSGNLTPEQEEYIKEVIEKIKDLENAIKDIEEQINDIHKVIDPLTPNNVKDSDRDKLDEIKDQIKNLIDNKHLSDDQIIDLNKVIDKIEELKDNLNELDKKFDELDKIEDIHKNNVSKDDQDVINHVKDIIDDIEKNYPGNLTDDQKDKLDEIKDKIDELEKVIDSIQDKIDNIKEELEPFTPENIKQSDRDTLDEIKKEIDDLLNNDQLTNEQRKEVNDLNDKLNDLYDRIDALDKLDDVKDKLDSITSDNVKDSDKEILGDLKDKLDDLSKNDSIKDKENEIKDLQDKIQDLEDKLNDINDKFDQVDKVEDINPDNVSKDDQDVINHVKDVIDDIEKNYPGNLTDDQKDKLDEIKDKIDDLQETIDQVKDVEKDIDSLDKKDEYTDKEKDIINDINDKYEALTDHQKDMVDPDLTDKLETILEIVRKKTVKNDQYQFVVEGIGQTDFDINTTLLVKDITEQFPTTLKQTISQSLNNNVELKDIYDISLLLDGKVIQPDGKIRIRIPLTIEQQLYQNIHLYYISDSGEMTEIEYMRDDNVIIFETDHLSYYAIIADKINLSDESKDNQSVVTADQSDILGLEILLVVSVYLLVILRKKKEI
ncbi:YDG domain-containing protein [Candidatus Stoquefichus massiliensis]|uniref:YDG domain-containing protein n=1 Tax=Candidatus Stoquefichus massiliensis TaxID=1470350 RepID=UPI0004862CFE|nr:YDG domain-containing protein [Candidatus Stoquefichus massiliensis]